MEVVRHLVANYQEIGIIICHSHNPKARDEMVRALQGAGYTAHGIPFYTLDEAGVYEIIEQQRKAESSE